ncbi:hypothetical protein F7734_26200 [Scytonema sp. UIC 10036]|uniref:hypothetical protein n=1 Tax=Scytonema sp. UIC 10036 TaxID=2304196 RepID=UPI0012DABFFD|nr:hypothetical protein [Scytonema sp. UIC 10036]MUG95658.1 hypothetical protein [Scytonema sp. UIC 10036]
MAKIAEHHYHDVRIEVANNPNTLPDTLRQLAIDKSGCGFNGQKVRYFVREAVASNPNTPIDVLTQLAQDEDEIVRAQVVANRSTPAEILQELARDRITPISNHIFWKGSLNLVLTDIWLVIQRHQVMY